MIDSLVSRWIENAVERWLETKHARQTQYQDTYTVRGIQVIVRLELAQNVSLHGADLSEIKFIDHSGDQFSLLQTVESVIDLHDILNRNDAGGEK